MMKLSGRKILTRALITIAGLAILFFMLDAIFPVKTDIAYAPVIEADNGKILHAYLPNDQQWRMKARLDEITPELKKAIVFKEDRHFYQHFGVNPFAVIRALIDNIFHLKRTSGASTITMQVARMLEPKPRTYINKIIEMFRAMQLELHYNKDEILQLYLNLVPYGSNIQGVKAASWLYFQKSPDQLSLAELTALSVIPNKPNSLVMGKDNDAIVQERNKWLQRFREVRLFPENAIKDALQEPLNAYRHDAPAAIPQLAWRLHKAFSGKPEIRTSINMNMQRKAENIVTNYVGSLRDKNVYNAAVLIVDNKTHRVLTYIGSADFKDQLHNGQVDGICAVRSPGSTLKPLLYGLAFDKGIITPKTIIADVPINFDGYAPENYDLSFRGNVTAEDALRNSLNIPAVKLLNSISVPEFVNKMHNAGFASVWKNRKKMGLSMILGGCGIRLDELTALYSSLANNGIYYPIQFAMPDSPSTKNVTKRSFERGVSIISPEADFMLTKILLELHRPDLPNLYDQAQGIPRIAWKTGTSYGRRDAWSVGYNKRYTIGVWVGNFTGEGVAGINGAMTATPLLFQLFNAIDKDVENEWLTQPEDIGMRLVCTKSGKLPNTFCNEQVMDYYIPGVSNNDRCDHLKQVWLSADGKYSYCTSCLPVSGYKTVYYEHVSPELAAYYDAFHIAYQKIPEHNPLCTRIFDGRAPVINSLTNGMVYIITDKNQQQLQLSCTTANDVEKIYWYINDRFLKSTKVGEKTFFIPLTPEVKISCTDDKGRNANIQIKVKFI